MSGWVTAQGANAGTGFGTGVVSGATLALTNHAKQAFSSPNELIIELAGLLTNNVIETVEGKTLAPETQKRVDEILARLREKKDDWALSEAEEAAVSALLEVAGDPKKLIAHASQLKQLVENNWGDGWRFIFKQFSVLRAYMMSEQGDSLIKTMTAKSVEALKTGFVGTASPLLTDAHSCLIQFMKNPADHLEATKQALSALLANPKEAFSGKDLLQEDKTALDNLQQALEDPREIEATVKKGIELIEKYMSKIEESALIPTMIKSLFENLQKKATLDPREQRAPSISGAIPPPLGAKKPLTYGAAFQRYIESIFGFLSHAFNRQAALQYAGMLLTGLQYAERSANGRGDIKHLIAAAKETIQVSIAKMQTADSDTNMRDLVSEMTDQCRQKLGHLQIYMNSIKLPIHTVESLEIGRDQLFGREEEEVPQPPRATDETIEAAKEAFIERTIRFLREQFGDKPFAAFYVRGFTTNVMTFLNTYVRDPRGDGYFEKRKSTVLAADRFCLILKNGIEEAKKSLEPFEIALSKELLKAHNNQGLTPEKIYEEFTNWAVDQFAPKHEWCKDLKEMCQSIRFRNDSPFRFLNIALAILSTSINWFLAPFAFLGQIAANSISPFLLKRIARETKLLPTLIQTAEESIGFKGEYQYAKDKALYTQLSKLWKVVRGPQKEEPMPQVSQEMKAKLQDLSSDLLKALQAHFKRLEASSTGYIPEEWIDTLAKKEVIEGLTQAFALGMNIEFEEQNLKEQTLQTLEMLTACYDDAAPVDMDEKRDMEKKLHELVQKLLFFYISQSIQAKLDPTKIYQKEAALWIKALKASAEKLPNQASSIAAFLREQNERIQDLDRNDQIDIPTRKMLASIATQGVVKLQEGWDSFKNWATGLQEIPFLNIQAVDTDPFIDFVTAISYARYKPLVESLMQLMRQSSVFEALLRHVVLLPTVR